MVKYRIFLGSSAEKREVAQVLARLLRERFGRRADVQFWPDAFVLSRTNIESLERIAQDADFAVLMLTADDALRIRRRKALTPRDNITFEIGFFMGQLGRERCYVVQERTRRLRVATDLLGVTVANVKLSSRKLEWPAALSSAVDKIATAVLTAGLRIRVDRPSLARRDSIRDFAERVAGPWWEQIRERSGDFLTFFELSPYPQHNSIRIAAFPGYNAEGDIASHWEADKLIARVWENEQTVSYFWEGYYVDPARPGHYHGMGKIRYETGPRNSSRQLRAGHGTFWDVNEHDPADSVERSTEVWRMTPSEYATMTAGSPRAQKLLVRKILKSRR